MRLPALDELACPHCLGPLEPSGSFEPDLQEGTLRCRGEGLAFPVSAGVPQLVRLDRAAQVAAFAESYSKAWQSDGWGSLDASYLLNLPHRDTTGRQAARWRFKARTMWALFDLLDSMRLHRFLDLGAGVGWLSHQLASRGHEVYAMDIVRDRVLGLAAAEVYLQVGPHFERVWGELERPPFRTESMDAIVCNASLHYASSLSEAVCEIHRILVPKGVLFVLNSPVYWSANDASRTEADFRKRLRDLGANEDVASTYHHFTRNDLESVLSGTIGPVREVPFDPGSLFRLVRAAKGFVLRTELASFPLLVAQKTADGELMKMMEKQVTSGGRSEQPTRRARRSHVSQIGQRR